MSGMKSGVGSSFLPEKTNGHRISRRNEIGCRFIILARKDERTPDFSKEKTNGHGTISRHIICSGQLFAQFFRSHPEELPEAQRGQLQAQQAVRRLILSVPGPELV